MCKNEHTHTHEKCGKKIGWMHRKTLEFSPISYPLSTSAAISVFRCRAAEVGWEITQKSRAISSVLEPSGRLRSEATSSKSRSDAKSEKSSDSLLGKAAPGPETGSWDCAWRRHLSHIVTKAWPMKNPDSIQWLQTKIFLTWRKNKCSCTGKVQSRQIKIWEESCRKINKIDW